MVKKSKIQKEREKRQQQLALTQQEKAQLQSRLSQLNVMELKLIGAIEQLDELEGVKPPEPSKDGAPKEVLEEKEN